MILTILTLVHVLISLIGIFSGLVVLGGMLVPRPLDGWTSVFLWTTVATSVTGFMSPVKHFMPSHAVGILSLLVLGLAIYARYGRHLVGGWRKAYVIGAVIGLYFNVFVAIVQSFEKVPAVKALAPTQSEPPFKMTQLTVLILFVILGVAAVIRFRPAAVAVTQ
jgi:hypothetical protein